MQTNPQEDNWVTRMGAFTFNPLVVRQIFLMMTRAHYIDPEHFGPRKDKMLQFVWSKEKESKLLIDYDFNYKEDSQEKRPAIFVGTDDYAFSRKVSDNHKSANDDRSGMQSIKRASTNVIIRHVADSPEDALILGDMTGQFFRGIQPFLMESWQKSGAVSIEVQRLATSKPFQKRSEQANQKFMADLVINLIFDDLWWHFTESHRLKTFSFQLAMDTLS